MRFLPTLLAASILLTGPLARAEDHDRPVRRRQDPTLFGVGLGTAIAGGVALNVGLGMAWIDSMTDGRSGDASAGAIVAMSGLGLVALGLPLAIVGGRKVPVGEVALVPVAGPDRAGAGVAVHF